MGVIDFRDYLSTYLKIKNKKYLKIGKSQFSIWGKYLIVLFGSALIAVGLYWSDREISYWGINSYGYLGLFFIIQAITKYENYLILFTTKKIKYKKDLMIFELKYNEIDHLDS